MPCYIRYLLSAVHTTWSDLNFAVGTEMEDENGGEGNVKTESEEKEGCGQVPWCGLSLSLNCYLPAGSGVFNLTLYSTIWEFIATSTRDCSGIKWLICLCYPSRIRGEHNFLVCQEIFLWAALFTSLTDYQLAPAHCLRHNKLWYQSFWPRWAPS